MKKLEIRQVVLQNRVQDIERQLDFVAYRHERLLNVLSIARGELQRINNKLAAEEENKNTRE